MKKLITMIVLFGILISASSCAFHSELSAGVGKEGTAHTAAMSGGRGTGIDFPFGAEDVQMEKKSTSNRVARD